MMDKKPHIKPYLYGMFAGFGAISLSILFFFLIYLKGLTSWEKAEALISVAHPDFRDELIAEAEKLHIWRRSNKR